jgi:hypothetical protein
MLRDSDREVRESAIAALGELGTPGVESLIAALKSPDGRDRFYAASALGKSKDSRAVNALEAALEDRDTEAISGAYFFFIERGAEHSEDALIEALNKSGDDQMANAFLECENEKLLVAVRTWTPIPGREKRQRNITGGLKWGHPLHD